MMGMGILVSSIIGGCITTGKIDQKSLVISIEANETNEKELKDLICAESFSKKIFWGGAYPWEKFAKIFF